MSEEVKLDWSLAEVHDGTVTVALEGKPNKEWKQTFERTTRLLNRGRWGEVTLKKNSVLIKPITPGDEDRARHFLEGVVLEANSAVQPSDEPKDAPSDDANGAEEQEASGAPEDQEMTKRLRSFAEADTGS
jgi:hypothetical protein